MWRCAVRRETRAKHEKRERNRRSATGRNARSNKSTKRTRTLFSISHLTEMHMTKLQTGGFFPLFDLPATIFDADVLHRLAQAMDSAGIIGASSCDSGYVYLGQFITHDITERGSLPAGKFVPASQLVQLRTPALD